MDIRNIEPYKDMFNLYNSIKLINKDYSLCFDKKNKCFLVVNFHNNNEICLKFNNFSLNVFELLQKTQISNSKVLFENIEKNNEKIRIDSENNLKNKASLSFEELAWLSKRTNKILPSDIKKLIEV